MSNKTRALDVIAQISTGTIDRAMFAPDATWWGNTGASFNIDEFQELLAVLHSATIGGLKIDPGVVVEEDDIVIVEATSHVPLVGGGVYSNRYLFLFRFEGRLVRQVKEYNDTAHLKECFADVGS